MIIVNSPSFNNSRYGSIHKGYCEEEEEEEEEEGPLLIYTAQGSPFRRKKLSVINGSPEQQRTKTH